MELGWPSRFLRARSTTTCPNRSEHEPTIALGFARARLYARPRATVRRSVPAPGCDLGKPELAGGKVHRAGGSRTERVAPLRRSAVRPRGLWLGCRGRRGSGGGGMGRIPPPRRCRLRVRRRADSRSVFVGERRSPSHGDRQKPASTHSSNSLISAHRHPQPVGRARQLRPKVVSLGGLHPGGRARRRWRHGLPNASCNPSLRRGQSGRMDHACRVRPGWPAGMLSATAGSSRMARPYSSADLAVEIASRSRAA